MSNKLLIWGIIIILLVWQPWVSPPVNQEEVRIIELSQCENLYFFEQVECMRDYIEPYYNYTIRDDTPKSFSNVMVNGGDCYDWSHLWKGIANDMGLKAEVTYIYGEDFGHAYVTIWNKELTGYCITSGLILKCIGLGS